MKTALHSKTDALSAKYDKLEKKLALLERGNTQRSASQSETEDSRNPAGTLAAGAVSSGGEDGNMGESGLLAGPDLTHWTLPALALLLACLLLLWRQRSWANRSIRP